MDAWLLHAFPGVQRWQYDDNSGDRSFPIFHVHVFIETIPFSFVPRSGFEYIPPHCQLSDRQLTYDDTNADADDISGAPTVAMID